MGIESIKNESSVQRYRVAVVDHFTKQLKLAGLNFSHGEAVEGILKAHGSNNIEILRFDIACEKANTKSGLDLIATTLIELAHRVQQGERIDIVNFSQGVGGEDEIKFLSVISGLDINRENIRSNKQVLRDLILNIDTHHSTVKQRLLEPGFIEKEAKERDITQDLIRKNLEFTSDGMRDYFGAVAKVIRAVEEVTALGVTVCIAAGNETKGGCNLITLANGITVVKSGDPNTGTVEEYSCDNGLVDATAIGTYKLARINM